VKAWFAANAFALGAPLRPFFDAFDDGHGRLVRRRVFACPHVGALAILKDWPGLAAVLAVETIRGIPGRGKVTAEIRHYLSSAALPPEALAAAIRDHWRIENGLHWVLDVTFREDASRVRERNATRNLALLRRIALNLARADRTRAQVSDASASKPRGTTPIWPGWSSLTSCVSPDCRTVSWLTMMPRAASISSTIAGSAGSGSRAGSRS
jgi:predicted transposase YbfD/YdcC